jgi:type I restriction-modification system DNA methylase subunit
MTLIMHLLKDDTSKTAVVLPDGFLIGEGTKTNLKIELLEEFNLHTIVRLPKGVFAPYASIATNILFSENGGPAGDVWFFAHPYPQGYRSYSRAKPLTIAEFDLEKAWWAATEGKCRSVYISCVPPNGIRHARGPDYRDFGRLQKYRLTDKGCQRLAGSLAMDTPGMAIWHLTTTH